MALIRNASALWRDGSPEQKQALQAVFFPEGLPFDGVAFGTAPMCLASSAIATAVTGESGVASPTGFEPVFQP